MTLQTQVEAALLVLPEGTVVSHVTGLQVRAVDLGPRTPLHFTTPHKRQVRLPGVHVHRRTVMPASANRRLSPERCFVDAASQLTLLDAVAAGDWLVGSGLASRERLAAEVAASAGVHGVAAARKALAYVRPRVESPRETVLRLLLVLAGLPEPLTNTNVLRGTNVIARADLMYPQYRVIVEYDGRHHAEDAYQWNRDLDRHDALADEGWRLVRVTARRMQRPRDVVARVHSQLVVGGYRGAAPRFDAFWMRLFESSPGAGARTGRGLDPA